MGAIFGNPIFWETLAFLVFVGILLRFGYRRIVDGLDARADKIKSELDDARVLREDAQTLLASRKVWSRQLLEAIDAGNINKSTLPLEVVRKLTIHRDDRRIRIGRRVKCTSSVRHVMIRKQHFDVRVESFVDRLLYLEFQSQPRRGGF